MANKILLHSCCAVCSAYPLSVLENAVVYFYNPNIFPAEEYQRRLEAQRTLCAHFGCDLIEEEYEPAQFSAAVKGLENEPEKGARCDKCFELRLEKTALKAKELNIKQFTSSLGISPHKDSEKIAEIGRKIAALHGLEYLDIDFKSGFSKTNKIAGDLGLYRQKYCGCIPPSPSGRGPG